MLSGPDTSTPRRWPDARSERDGGLLLGREQEQAELYDALSLALKGEPQVVVVAGDAGVGKTTLVADLARRAEELGFTVAIGHCLDIEAGISFAPVVEAVSTLVAGVEDARFPPARTADARRSRPRRRRGVSEQLNLLEDLRLTVLEAAASGPVLLVLEDLHWADASTRDFAVALSRTARGRLLFVLTVRSDDLHRRHPARKALAEIGRVPRGRRVELGPLDRDSIAGIVASITGAPPDPAWSGPCWSGRRATRCTPRRSSPPDRERSPTSCPTCSWLGSTRWRDGPRELVADRLRGRDTGGHRHARPSWRASTRRGWTRSSASCSTPTCCGASGDSLEFRHGLLREAVYDDLLPDERTRLHAELRRHPPGEGRRGSGPRPVAA